MSTRVLFQDVPRSERIAQDCEALASELRSEFPETSKVEITLTRAGDQHETRVRVTGKDLDLAASSRGERQTEAVSDAFDRARRQLRKRHDKLIFGRRREAPHR
ncbi:MAG: HPF/RaiA family ribosome-associated protein [Myxococcota bacterium]